MIRFVQACNRAYAPQGLALFRSLQRHMSGEWCMDWYGLDDVFCWGPIDGNDPRLRVIPGHAASRYECDECHRYGDVVAEILGLDEALRARDTAPWFWTWASQATHHAIESNPDDVVVYLDTDTFAFGDLRPAIEEVLTAGADVGMLTHRFPPYRQVTHGKRGGWWCGFNVFAPTVRARAAAAWWAAMVRARCVADDPGDDYLDIPAGLAGDQAPLHALSRIARVHEIRTPGLLASWNWDGYVYANVDVPGDDSRSLGVFVNSGGGASTQQQCSGVAPVRLVHYHEFKFDACGNIVKRTGYETPGCVTERLVNPYEAAVQAAAKELVSA